MRRASGLRTVAVGNNGLASWLVEFPDVGASLMRQVNIWIVLAILLALLAVTRYLRDERDERLERLCAENPSASECQED